MTVLTISIVNLVTTSVLVGVTAWYAFSTAKMLTETRRQIHEVHKQSILLSKSAQITAWAALGSPEANKHIQQLVSQLEGLDAHHKD
jgi:hypothetical protein